MKSHVHVDACVVSCFSRVQLFATLWTVACQAPPSLGFSRQEYWSGLPCSSPVHIHRQKQMTEPRLKPSILDSKSFSIFLPWNSVFHLADTGSMNYYAGQLCPSQINSIGQSLWNPQAPWHACGEIVWVMPAFWMPFEWTTPWRYCHSNV